MVFKPLNQLILYRFMDIHIIRGYTGLATVHPFASCNPSHCLIEVGILMHNGRRFSAQFQRHRDQLLGGGLHDDLAYVRTSGKENIVEDVLSRTTSGDAEINSTIVHVGVHFLPFGGVGTSGMGKYHGQYSFQTFSHMRSVLEMK